MKRVYEVHDLLLTCSLQHHFTETLMFPLQGQVKPFIVDLFKLRPIFLNDGEPNVVPVVPFRH